ncbi:hypothetical protein Rs2_49991 [Raphanus sativus]|nr:hypothetical protein Rs2_49991 [Raphanus sativus]
MLDRKYQFCDTCCLDSGSQRHLAFHQVVLTLLVVVWGLRLGMFLLMRILKWGEDPRFDEKRENMGKLVIFWTSQAVWVWTISLPVTFVNASNGGRLEDCFSLQMLLIGLCGLQASWLKL